MLIVPGQGFHVRGCVNGLSHEVVPSLNERRRRASGRGKSPGRCVDRLRKTHFLHGGCIGPQGAGPVAEDGQHPHLALFHPRCKTGGVHACHQLPGGNRQHLVGRALVGDVDVGDTETGQDVLHGQMGRAAHASGTQLQLSRVSTCPFDQFMRVPPGAVGRYEQAERGTRHLNDGLQVDQWVPVHRAHQGVSVDRDRHLPDRVAVGGGLFEPRRHQRAGRARAIANDHGLAQLCLADLGQQADGQIGRATGGPGNDEFNMAAGPFTGPCPRAGAGRQGASSQKLPALAAEWRHREVSPSS